MAEHPEATNGLEQCGWSPKTGKFYQNVPGRRPGNDTAKAQLAVIDPKTMKVRTISQFRSRTCTGPQGMAIGPDNQILLGCNATSPDGHRNTVVIDAKSGAVLKVLKDLGGVDEVWFNPDDGHYIIPSCNTPCRTVPVTGAITGHELLGHRRLKRIPAGPVGYDRGAEQRHDVYRAVIRARCTRSQPVRGTQIFLPIPAVGGTAPQFDPSLCDTLDGTIAIVGTPTAATGCIAVFAAKPNKDDRSQRCAGTG